ncbi:MAG: ferritin-like domain-containing protein [Acidimicrobiia bacterium]|nr:ferritin-like domain-containing protein [Acidimicrobiia bacterium]
MADTTTETETTTAAPNRRRFLLGGGVLAAGALLAACGDDDTAGGTTTTAGGAAGSTSTTAPAEEPTTTTAGGTELTGDLAVAALAASLEVLAVSTYGAALDAAGSGALGEVPPAVAEFVTVAMAQHQEHLDAWNEVLTGAGEEEVTEPPADLAETVNGMFAEVTDVAGAANLALTLEGIASATYLGALPVLEDPAAIELAGSILCIDRQHEAVLLFALGQYPVPDVFANTEAAYSG